MGVRPMIIADSKRKWSAQRSRRGSNKGTNWPVSGSREAMLGPFRRLQSQQASAKLKGRRSAMLTCDDMIGLVEQERVFFGNEAVFAAAMCSLAIGKPKRIRNCVATQSVGLRFRLA